jgi:hypothetical protein
MAEYFTNIRDELSLNKLKKPIGCPESEITDLEKRIGFELPDAYKAYLKLLGRDYDGVLCGTDCFIDHAIENTEYLSVLLNQNHIEYDLPESYLVFYCHQGYINAWFELPMKSEDPICHYYHEVDTDAPIEKGTFSEFMSKETLDRIDEALECRRLIAELKMNRKWWQFWV